ncbi:MAG TPA: hypothetical protein VG937_13575 [Polyangiaceae bacterium]|nr:hypothetical protein [Polyangiaceae bacterium]
MSWFSRKPYKVSMVGIMAGIQYQERDRKMVIDCTLSGVEHAVLVFVDGMVWKPPHDTEPVTAEEKRKVMERIERDFHYPTKWVSREDSLSSSYRVTLVGSDHEIAYEENRKRMLIPYQTGENEKVWIATMDDIVWQRPDSAELSNEEKLRIVENIAAALPAFKVSWKPHR